MERLEQQLNLPIPPSWLKEILDDVTLTDLCINTSRSFLETDPPRLLFWVERGGVKGLNPVPCPSAASIQELKNWMMTVLHTNGKSWDARYPFADAIFGSGSRFRMHAVLPPVSGTGLLLSLRRLGGATEAITGSWQAQQRPYSLLREIVLRGDSLIVSGATGTGKTTLINTLLGEIPHHERIIALEDTPELAPRHPHFLSLTSRPGNSDGFGEIGLRDLLRECLRMRPDRVILGECRGAEVLELLQALNTGHAGAMATLHASSPRDALRRIELLCLIASRGQISTPVIRELVASGVRWLVHLGREPRTGKREIASICRLEGREGDTILLRPMLKEET